VIVKCPPITVPAPARFTKSIEDFINGAPDAAAYASKSRVMTVNQAQITLTIPLDLLDRASAVAARLSISLAAFIKLPTALRAKDRASPVHPQANQVARPSGESSQA
jgi:hypothetical protein